MTEQERISQIEQSLAGLEKKLFDLKLELNDLKQSTQAASVVSVPEKAADTPVVSETIPEPVATQTPVQTPVHTSAVVQTPVQTQTSQNQKSASRFEENLGGKVMGIIAAGLVFVGLLLFGSMLYERLGNTARVIILFLVSFLILGAGLFFEKKHQSRFTTSLIGCGFGAVYISLFVTALYFRMIDKEVLYILLFFWLAGTGLYVFYKQSYTVAILGQIGIAFSVILGSLAIDTKAQFTFLCIFFILSSLLYLWVVLWRFLPDTQKKPFSRIHLVAVCLNLLQLWILALRYGEFFGRWGSLGGRNWTAAVLLALYSFALPFFFLLHQRAIAKLSPLPFMPSARKINKETFPVYKAGIGSVLFFTANQIVTWFVFSRLTEVLFDAHVPCGLVLLSGLLISFLIAELFGPTGTEGRGAGIVTVVALCFVLMMLDFPILLQILLSMVFAAVTLFFGLYGTECPLQTVLNPETRRWESLCKEEKGRCFEKFIACTYFLPILLSYNSSEPFGILLLIILFGVLFFGTAFLFLYRSGKEHRFADAWKVTLFAFATLFLFTVSAFFAERFDIDDIVQQGIVISVLTLCNCAALYSGFRSKLTDTKSLYPAANVTVYLVHNALWIWGISLLHSGAMEDHPVLCIWMLLLTMFLCGSGMYEQYKLYRAETGLGIYFGLRITVYMIAVMTAFDVIPGYVISCALLLLAVLAVLAGFPLRLAPLRIYGLCLAMLAVVKLLMIDVEHDNSMETVLCFLGAGALCFAINFIYSHVKKRFQNDIR